MVTSWGVGASDGDLAIPSEQLLKDLDRAVLVTVIASLNDQ